MKRACLLLLPAMLMLVLAATGCSDDESKPIITRVFVAPACGVAPLSVDAFAAVSGGNETGDPMGGTNGLEMNWNFGDGGSGSTAVNFHQYAVPGEYQVTVTAKDPDGNLASAVVAVTVMADSLVISAESDFPDGNVTAGQRIQFGLTVAACGIDFPTVAGDSVKMVYRWEMGDANDTVFTGTSPGFIYTQAGDYDVNLAVTYPAQAVTRHTSLHFTVSP